MKVRAGEPLIALDLMRATAALLVVLGHVKQSGFVAYADLPVADQGPLAMAAFVLCRLGNEAVLVFFALSGLLVGGRVIERVAEGRFDLKSYAIERFSRIVLPLVPAIVLTLLVDQVVFAEPPSAMTTLAHIAGLNGVLVPTFAHNVPLWSLAYEIWFYVLAAGIAYFLATRRPSTAAFAVTAVATLVFSVLSARYLVFWTLGALSILLLRSSHQRAMAFVGSAIALVGVVFSQLAQEAAGSTAQHLVPRPLAEAVITIGVCLLLPLLCSRKSNQALSWLRGPASYLSSISYTLYLTHFPINAVMEKMWPQATDLSWPSLGLFALRLAIVWLVAQVFYFAFESRTPALRRTLARFANKSVTVS